jgi:hypothetical protein
VENLQRNNYCFIYHAKEFIACDKATGQVVSMAKEFIPGLQLVDITSRQLVVYSNNEPTVLLMAKEFYSWT